MESTRPQIVGKRISALEFANGPDDEFDIGSYFVGSPDLTEPVGVYVKRAHCWEYLGANTADAGISLKQVDAPAV